ncbi:hypothetical protein CEXT_755581 [Caerostris extrusa]|uniref:Uncharacterized protein n=1 Tax=Caerostris extrusa TaxID=172846 RepID=A0AAV4PK07_CAEEX|nr:hypothetical protein CEXT_755581 [Caerostris extrusa]
MHSKRSGPDVIPLATPGKISRMERYKTRVATMQKSTTQRVAENAPKRSGPDVIPLATPGKISKDGKEHWTRRLERERYKTRVATMQKSATKRVAENALQAQWTRRYSISDSRKNLQGW